MNILFEPRHSPRAAFLGQLHPDAVAQIPPHVFNLLLSNTKMLHPNIVPPRYFTLPVYESFYCYFRGFCAFTLDSLLYFKRKKRKRKRKSRENNQLCASLFKNSFCGRKEEHRVHNQCLDSKAPDYFHKYCSVRDQLKRHFLRKLLIAKPSRGLG